MLWRYYRLDLHIYVILDFIYKLTGEITLATYFEFKFSIQLRILDELH